MIATRRHRCLAENIHSFMIKRSETDVENKNKARDCDEPEVHVQVGISFTAGKDSVGRFPSPQDHGVKTLMLHRSYWKRTGGQKRQRGLRMKEERDWSEGDLGLLLLERLQNMGSRCLMFFLISAAEPRGCDLTRVPTQDGCMCGNLTHFSSI